VPDSEKAAFLATRREISREAAYPGRLCHGYRPVGSCPSSVSKSLTRRKTEKHEGPRRQNARLGNAAAKKFHFPRSSAAAVVNRVISARSPHAPPWHSVVLIFFSVLKYCGGRTERRHHHGPPAERPPQRTKPSAIASYLGNWQLSVSRLGLSGRSRTWACGDLRCGYMISTRARSGPSVPT
jgi:hypothetical protein